MGEGRPAPERRASRNMLRLTMLFALVAIAYLGYRVSELEALVLPYDSGEAIGAPLVVARGDLSEVEKATTEIFRKASSSVVHITTLDVKEDPFSLRALEVPQGTGSGFFWDERGHVVTNMHVLQGANGARVTLPDHSVWPAQLVGVSPRHDLAVLKVPGAIAKSRPLALGSSHDLLVGQSVVAIGSPFGLDYTLSTGVISGLGREIPGQAGRPIRDAIQTDAAINPGNSGGPLLDSAGRLIGVNTAIVSPSGASAGIGFAVPVAMVARIIPQLVRYGREVRPIIGVRLATDTIARRVGARGALVLDVPAGTPAAEAGIRPTLRAADGRIVLGDVIVGVDGVEIRNAADVHEALDPHQPGDVVKLSLDRGGELLELQLKLAANVDL